MILADYTYYTQEYGGKTIAEADFTRHARAASAYVNAITFGRAEKSGLDCVKDAVCAAAEIYHEADKRAGITSENNDGYSVTFASAADTASRVGDIVRTYLSGTGLLYRGAYPYDDK